MIKKWIDLLIYKPNTKEIYWNKIFTIVSVITIFFVIVYFNNIRLAERKKQRENFGRYTIGVTTDTYHANGHLYINYEYYFLGIKYEESKSPQRRLISILNSHGGRYYVLLASNNPTNAVMLFEYPVPDSIGALPDSGWEYMPGYDNIKKTE